MPGKKKKKSEAEAGADAPTPKSGKGKAMALGAGLLLAGAMGQRFVLSSPPAQVVIAAPIDGGVAASSSGHGGVDCSAMHTDAEAGAGDGGAATETPHPRTQAASTGGSADLSSMTINLADGHYLKIGITLELGDSVIAEEFTSETAKAADVVLNYFSTKSTDELTSDKHGAIKVELTCLLQEAYAHPAEEGADTMSAEDPVITNVLFREFLTS